MRIVFISPEVYPFSKTGGLADVSYALPKALAKAGHDVCVVTPGYKNINKEKYGLSLVIAPLVVHMGLEDKYAAVMKSSYIPGVESYFIDYEKYFGRDGLYGCNTTDFRDNAGRFQFFAKAALKALKEIDIKPEVIHCNDWQTGLVPIYLKSDKYYNNCASVMTVHNAAYQGVFPESSVDISEISVNTFDMEDILQKKGIGFLKAGIIYSDAITTVSKKYAGEIQTPEFGYELADVFISRKDRLYGILNGIDVEEWNPETDPNLPANYSAENVSGKLKCKLELQSRMNLAVDPDIPLIGTVSRLSYQKGMDILADALELLLQDEKFQFVITGSGEQGIALKFNRIKKMFPHAVGINWEYDEGFSHLIEAGLDIFIMPSRYEPCGLNQMYSLIYGTVPVVRATGGLDEIIIEWDEKEKTGNGFKFQDLSRGELYDILRKVIRKYKFIEDWGTIRKNGMQSDFRWENSVLDYEKVYKIALKQHKSALLSGKYNNKLKKRMLYA